MPVRKKENNYSLHDIAKQKGEFEPDVPWVFISDALGYTNAKALSDWCKRQTHEVYLVTKTVYGVREKKIGAKK